MSAPTRPRTSRQENLALLLGGIGFAVGGVIALFVLRPQSPIFGRGSAGELGAFVASVVALIAGVVWLHLGVGYLNITAFEMGAVSTVFVWLVLLIRTVTAAVSEIPETSPAEVEVAAP